MADDNVIPWGGITRLSVPPENVLAAALETQMSAVVICGFDADGNEYFASSEADGASTLWHLARAQYKLLKITDTLAEED